MSLKEFDAKQFLLEKGEQVGLGVALTLMVLMLILSLFLPSKGFFSGSPGAKARELNTNTKQLEDALATRQPGEKDLPEKREGKLIALDTHGLEPDNYATEILFEPRMKDNKARRPPKIYNVEEAIAKAVAVPIDTYLMRLKANPPSIMVLQGKGGARVGGGGGGQGGQFNPFTQLMRGMGGGPGGRGGNSAMQRQQQMMLGGGNLGALKGLQGAADNTEYETRWIPLDDWSPQQLTARQLVPLRMAIIAGSFPYKKQIQEHQSRLRLKNTDEVLNETIGEKDKQTAAFDFRGVEVERREVDADGKPLGEWMDPKLKDAYQVWLEHTYLPFQPEDSKYESVQPNGGRGLVMPLLREFHANKPDAPGLPGLPGGGGMAMFQRMMMGGGKGLPQLSNAAKTQTPPEESKPSSRYPDLAAELPKIKETLDNIEKAQPKQIAAAHKFQKAEFLNPFDANSALPADKDPNQNPGLNAQGNAGGESYVPDYVLVRVVDVTIEPGKNYQYRLKVKMANPNYKRDDVASPEYKVKETLESSDWYPLEQIVKAPPEQYNYVVDEMHGVSRREIMRTIPRESAQYRLLMASAPSPASEQLAFQFHRWVETTQQSRRDTEPIPVGEWAVADRVFVARGEYIGGKVNIDIPIWKYTQNMFILPAEDQKPNRRTGRVNTGIDVDFGQDPPENNLILVDFEGGRVSSQTPKVDDTCAIEVLMLSPDGKLLARNSVKDTNDEERKDRRDKVLKRIQDVREGKGTE